MTMRGFQLDMSGDNMKEKEEIRDAESLLRDELRFMDIDGTRVAIKDIIDRVLEQDKEKRRYSTG